MPAPKKMPLLAVLVCIALAVVWFAIPSKQPLTDPDAPDIAPAHESRTATPDTAHDPEVSESPEESTKPKSIARKHGQSAKEERLAADYGKLKSVFAGGWEEAAFRVGAYGDPDEATGAILDLIENRDDVTRQDWEELEDWPDAQLAKLRTGDYRSRIEMLTYLGLPRTKRAEEFLLDAYRNPPNVVPNKKYVNLASEQRALGYDFYADSGFLDSITRRYALTGLLVLDEPRYSLMLEEDFYALVPDAERIYKKHRSRRTVEEKELVSRLGVLLDLMLVRDAIRERGTENPMYLLDPYALKGDLTKYWNFHTETAVERR